MSDVVTLIPGAGIGPGNARDSLTPDPGGSRGTAGFAAAITARLAD